MLQRTEQPIDYSAQDQRTWAALFTEMTEKVLPGRVYEPFWGNLDKLGIAGDSIPELGALGAVREAGWEIIPVSSLAEPVDLVECYAKRHTPICVPMRPWHQMHFSDRPDIFHDVFGHLTLLMNPSFREFMYAYGIQGLQAKKKGYLTWCDRLFFRAEFGVINTPKGHRAYGPALVSSRGEILNCLENPDTKRLPFDLMSILKTPATDAEIQDTYYCIDSFDQLIDAVSQDLTPYYQEAREQERISA